MNQQKKLAMINGARANSLATGNPMMGQQSQYMGVGQMTHVRCRW